MNGFRMPSWGPSRGQDLRPCRGRSKFAGTAAVPLVGAALVVAMLGGCTHQQAFTDAQREIENQDRVIKRLSDENQTLVTENRLLTTRVESLKTQVSTLEGGNSGLESDLAAVNQGMRDLESQLRELASLRQQSADSLGTLGDGVRVKAHPDGVAVEVAETVLFPSGKANLTDSGKAVLRDIASKLRDLPGQIRVEGHTDNAPVVVHAKEYPMGNLQLSGRRALVVADYLIEAGGLPARRVAFAGFGEHRPMVANDSGDNMRRNRRVEIVLVNGG